MQSEVLQGKAEVCEVAKRPQTDIGSSKKSIHTRVSSVSNKSSIEARKKQLLYEAAKEKAEIVKKEAETQKQLVEMKLAAELAALEDQHSSRQSSRHQPSDGHSVRTLEKVQEWLERSHESDRNFISQNQQPEKEVGHSGEIEMKTLVSALHQATSQNQQLMSRFATSKDLPQFYGDALEWLGFKQAYDESTEFCKYSDAENMWRLRKALRGEAKETVLSLLNGNTCPKTVIEALELRFGRPEVIINKITYQLRKMTPLSQNYHQDIVSFAIKIRNFVAAAQAVNQIDYLRSPELISSVLIKCPSALINKWADYYNVHLKTETPKLEILANFLYEEASKISTAGLTHIHSQSENKKKPEDRKHHALLLTEKQESSYKCKFCRSGNHKLTECTRFKRAMTKDRWRFVRANHLCHKCLLASHNRDTCSEPACGIGECSLPHHRYLHWKTKTECSTKNSDTKSSENRPITESDKTVNQNNIVRSVTSDYSETVTYTNNMNNASVCLKVVPVKVYGPRGMLNTYALLDDGATISLISSEVANRVGLRGEKQTLSVRGAWDSKLTCNSEIIKCKIINQNNESYELCARKISELNLPLQKLSDINMKNYKHLYQISAKLTCLKDVKPTLLIGQDNYHLISPIKIIMGHNKKSEPCATLTPLGWCIHGVYRNQSQLLSPECVMITATEQEANNAALVACSPPAADSIGGGVAVTTTTTATHTQDVPTSANSPRNHIQIPAKSCTAIHTDLKTDAQLHELVRKSFMFESIGVHNKSRQNKSDLTAIEIVNKSARLIEGRWEIGLPWKDENVKMVDSYPNAYRRLKTAERKMMSDKDYNLRYKERIDHLFSNNYARVLEPNEDLSNVKKIWYLPHFGVDNPNKKKLRLVYDAAAKSCGQSLNDYLLPGPNLLESLLGIMLRFREKPIGLTGDIKDMFLRIKVRPEDQHALRFLWRDNPDEDIKKYVMTSLIFGANCSPFIAQHVKNLNAQRYSNAMPEAVQAIVKNHFMDDYIDCFDDADTAIKTMKQVSYIHQQGGFEIRNWTSNKMSVCHDMPTDTLSPAIVNFKGEVNDVYERTLGLLWYPNTDTFGFNLSLERIPKEILSGEKIPTKRELLRIVMSIFDIYGLLAPFTVNAKIIMQTSWKTNLQWDEEIKSTEFEIFSKWIVQLQRLKEIRIPRWYFRISTDKDNTNENDSYCKINKVCASETLQLHVFCDASPTAYAAVAYWRVHSNNNVCVSFIASKSRVAPLKPVTIPRLELQAAVLGCRLADTIQKEHRLQPIKRYLWTDSTTVLHWIKNENRNYNVFVANRLGELDELSSTHEWHYIPTEKNIADVATKINKYELRLECEWFRGPKFLYESDWFQQRSSAPETEKIQNEEICDVMHVCQTESTIPVANPENASSWLRLKRSTATMLLFIEKCKKNITKAIDTEIMKRAEILLLRYCQMEAFASEILLLKNKKPIQVNSRLRMLTPFIDREGLLRAGGRVEAASHVSPEMKNPIILDGRHVIAKLITKELHIRSAHGSSETVVNELRQRYWILNLRPTVRGVAYRCLVCRIRKAKPCAPRMADLPDSRLAHHNRPFTHCGVDLFGPIEVTVGRRREQRYGVLFTCMTVRAVHIETVPSLTADSFIMALRRMASRRGWPQYMYSDNGTNLRGAEVELRKSFLESESKVNDELANIGIIWNFNSPVSPHKGGAWERLIRSVKTALKITLKERAPREEVLTTLLTEIEHTVNSRPLTHVSVDPECAEALTPNHFLIGTSSNLPVPGVFDDSDMYLRKMWRAAQRLADMFWQRWIKEVLPTLIPRQKWYLENDALKVGDVVVVVDPRSCRNTWPKGVVVNVYPGKDGRIRTVDIKTKTGVLTRPAARLALLPVA